MKKTLLILCFVTYFSMGEFVLFKGKCNEIESKIDFHSKIEYFGLMFRTTLETPKSWEFDFLNNLNTVIVNGTNTFLGIFPFCPLNELVLQKSQSEDSVIIYFLNKVDHLISEKICLMPTNLTIGVFVKKYTVLVWVCYPENDDHHHDFIWIFADYNYFNKSIVEIEVDLIVKENNLTFLNNFETLEEVEMFFSSNVSEESEKLQTIQSYCPFICSENSVPNKHFIIRVIKVSILLFIFLSTLSFGLVLNIC